jgi:hypothetical protein
MAVIYDEVYISTKREIGVCESAIKKLNQDIADMEKKYSMSTVQFISRGREADAENRKDFIRWRDCCEGLRAWEKRRKELGEMLEK